MSEEAAEQAEKFYDAFLRAQMFVKNKSCHAWYDERHRSENKFKMQTCSELFTFSSDITSQDLITLMSNYVVHRTSHN
jgi:hypothetical protein